MGWTCAYCQASSGPAGNSQETKHMLNNWVVDHHGLDYHRKCLGKSLSIQRERAKISMREMARRLNISIVYLRDLELGNRKWSIDKIETYYKKLQNS